LTGHIDHSARVMQIITWNRSFSGLQNGDDGKDDFENDPSETLATVVDKILAWEKKLYDEVKVHFIPVVHHDCLLLITGLNLLILIF
jgi:hypothetical protein